MTTMEPTSAYEFDVALSYAGEDRAYVVSVAEQLRNRGVAVFFAEDAQADLWGTDLLTFFDDVFRKQARFAMLFVSRYYVSKPWTRHESRSAQARAFTESAPYVLPVRLDDTDLPGLPPTIGYVSASHTSAEQLADLVMQKLGKQPGPRAVPSPPVCVPRSPEQLRDLVGRRPQFWEYLLFAGILIQRRDALDAKFHDHELRYVRPAGPLMNGSDALTFLQSCMNDFQLYGSNVMRTLDPLAQEAAFGPRDTPGDPARIEHLGERLVAVYEDFLDAAARIRGCRVSDDFRNLCDLAADFATAPVRDIHRFIDDFAARLESAIAQSLNHTPSDPTIVLDMTLVLSFDTKLGERFNQELHQMQRRVAGK
jgi:hypothetical protein